MGFPERPAPSTPHRDVAPCENSAFPRFAAGGPLAASRAHPGRRSRRLGDRAWPPDRLSRQCSRGHEEAENQPIRSRCARSQKSLPTLVPEPLAHLLVVGPASAPGSRREQPYAREPVRRAEIGNVDRADAVAPDVTGELLQRRDASLGEVPIPLSPERVLAVGEVEGIDDVAALPAVVPRRLWASAWISSVRDLTQPRAGGVDRIDVEYQGARPQTAPGDSSSDTTCATRRARPRAIISSGF
jgi:hypothetical protein